MSDYSPATWVNGATGLSAARMNNIESGIDDAHEELQHSVTFTVAANNSSTAEKQAADYLCDGTADQVEINNAITAAAALGGGEVVLLGGYYYTPGSILLKDYVKVRGLGSATRLKIPNATNTTFDVFKNVNEANLLYDAGVYSLIIDGNKALQASGVNQAIQITKGNIIRISDVFVYSMKGAGIVLNTDTAGSWVDRCRVEGCDGAGIDLENAGADIIISKNYVASNNYGIAVNVGAGTAASDIKIIDNNCISNSNDGIYVTLATYCDILRNKCSSNTGAGIYFYDVDSCSCNNNTVYSNGTNGINVTTCNHCNVLNNSAQIGRAHV